MDYNKKILQFFTDELSQEQRQELAFEVSSDSNVAEDLKLQQEVLYAIANIEEDNSEFRKQLQDIGKEFMDEELEEKRPSIRINYWLAAASVIVVIGLGSYLGLLRDSNYTGGQAFVEYYSPYGTDLTVRGHEQSDLFVKAIQSYQTGDITVAIESFEALSDDNEELAGFFLGLCQIELGNIELAKQELLATKEGAIFYADQIDWYLALCYIKQQEYNQAELLLTQIMTGGNQYADNAKELLEKLKI